MSPAIIYLNNKWLKEYRSEKERVERYIQPLLTAHYWLAVKQARLLRTFAHQKTLRQKKEILKVMKPTTILIGLA